MLVLLLFTASLAVTGEFDLGVGYEPVVSCDRSTGSGKRVQVVWPTTEEGTAIKRRYSTDLGSTWNAVDSYSGTSETRLDAMATSNVFDGNTPPHMYFGWLTQLGTSLGAHFRRSTSGNNVDSAALAQGMPLDRPWLVCNTANLFLSYSNSTSDPRPYVKRAAVSTLDWTNYSSVLVANPRSGATFVGSFPIATTHTNGQGDDVTYVMARQEYSGSPPDLFYNAINVYKSTDHGANWASSLVQSVEGADNYVVDRDRFMVPFHVTCDPAEDLTKVYAFYVRNEVTPALGMGATRNVLYCQTSHDGGSTWNGEVRVYTISPSEAPSGGWADVPVNSFNSTTGFYRIGRVWSCVDPSGNL